MIKEYWGLSASPFEDSLDCRWFHQSSEHEEALARLHYLIEQQRRYGVIVGPSGVGKSLTLLVLRRQLQQTSRQCAYVELTGINADQLLWHLTAELRLAPCQTDRRLILWLKLQDYLHGATLCQQSTVFLLDHIDRASPDCRQLIGRLIQLDPAIAEKMTVIVAGRSDSLWQSAGDGMESWDLSVRLSPLTQKQTSEYILAQLKRTEGRPGIFTQAARDEIYSIARGVPRSINRLCELAMLAAMTRQAESVDVGDVKSAANELESAPQPVNRLMAVNS